MHISLGGGIHARPGCPFGIGHGVLSTATYRKNGKVLWTGDICPCKSLFYERRTAGDLSSSGIILRVTWEGKRYRLTYNLRIYFANSPLKPYKPLKKMAEIASGDRDCESAAGRRMVDLLLQGGLKRCILSEILTYEKRNTRNSAGHTFCFPFRARGILQ